jgi:hypothetical protein
MNIQGKYLFRRVRVEGAKQNHVLPFNKTFRLDCSLVLAGAADERMFAMPCGSSVISGGVGWCEPVSSWIDTLPCGSSYGKSCSEIETAELSSCVPGVELRSDVVSSVPCMFGVGSSCCETVAVP